MGFGGLGFRVWGLGFRQKVFGGVAYYFFKLRLLKFQELTGEGWTQLASGHSGLKRFGP